VSKKEKSVIRPDDIPIKTDRYQTVLSPVVSDLAASILDSPPDRTKPAPGGSYYHAETFAEIETRREKVDELLKKYEGG
jgi:hypothetical protein